MPFDNRYAITISSAFNFVVMCTVQKHLSYASNDFIYLKYLILHLIFHVEYVYN